MATEAPQQSPPAAEVNGKAQGSAPTSAESSNANNEQNTKAIQDGVANLTTEDKLPGGVVKEPFAFPFPSTKPVPMPELTSDQQTKYDELLTIVKGWTEVPVTSAKNAAKEPIMDVERMWLTRECLLRYLRAVKWTNATAASKRLMETLTWRREYGVYTFTADYIAPEQETGKQVILGFDNDARPCLYLRPNKQNTQKSDRQLHHLVFMLERLIDLMPAGQETTALLIDFKESSSGSNPSVSQGKQTLTILQGHYPERLGRALISSLPWYVTTFFKLISPFIDPVTKTKMKFNEPLSDHVPKSQLWNVSGGDVDFQYDHAVYWPKLNAICDERKEAYKQRWEKAGKLIGESEVYLRGGDEPSVSAGAK